MFDFEKLDAPDLFEGPTPVNREGARSLLDHRWVWMGLFIFGLGVALHNAALTALTAFMLVTVAFCWLWNRWVMLGLSYRRVFSHRRAFAGETLEVTILVENRKFLPMPWLQVEDEWPTAFGPAEEGELTPSSTAQIGYIVNVYSLRWYERVRRRYLLLARQRGVYPVGPAHAISGDPFSLFETGVRIGHPDTLIVYPRVHRMEALGLSAKDPFGDLRNPQRIFEDPMRTLGVRDYHPGDPQRSVHWKATARKGSLQVRQHEPSRSLSLVLCLNIASFAHHWQGTWPALTEHLIEVAGSVASWGIETGYAVGITANATLAQADRSLMALPAHGQQQLMHLLETLASISYFISREFSEFLLAESMRLPWGATLIVVTGFINEAIAGALLQLHANGRRLVVISVGVEPPPDLPGIFCTHIPLPDGAASMPPVASLTPDNQPLDGDGSAAPETPRQRYLRLKAANEADQKPI